MQFKKTYGRPVWNKYYICEILSTSTRVWHRGSKIKKQIPQMQVSGINKDVSAYFWIVCGESSLE